MASAEGQPVFSMLPETFQSMIKNPELMFRFLDLLPTPIEIFDSEGLSIYVNQASLEMTGCSDASLIVGKYNLKNDPVCLEIIGQDIIDRIFRGEAVSFKDFPAPVQDLVDRGVIKEKPWEASTMDLFMLPIWQDDKFVCTICFFTIKSVYKGRADVVDARKYIDNNWREEFDPQAVAKSLNVSLSHLRALFKRQTGMTLYDYYKKTKIEHIKEKLADFDLTIAEAFDACGADSRATYARIFKEMTGMSSTQYREGLKNTRYSDNCSEKYTGGEHGTSK